MGYEECHCLWINFDHLVFFNIWTQSLSKERFFFCILPHLNTATTAGNWTYDPVLSSRMHRITDASGWLHGMAVHVKILFRCLVLNSQKRGHLLQLKHRATQLTNMPCFSLIHTVCLWNVIPLEVLLTTSECWHMKPLGQSWADRYSISKRPADFFGGENSKSTTIQQLIYIRTCDTFPSLFPDKQAKQQCRPKMHSCSES